MARLYADEHFPVAIVYALRRLGHSVITVRETNVSKAGEGMPDELVLQFAAQQQRVVLTRFPPTARAERAARWYSMLP